MNPRLKKLSTWLPVIIALTFIAGMWSARIFTSMTSRNSGNDKLSSVIELIGNEYVDEVDIDSLLEMTYPQLLANLDPHSTYIPAADLQSVNDELEGSFSGIGITFTMLNDSITVLEVLSGGPSEKVGLLPGDRIVTINDSVASGRNWSNEKVMKNLRGEKGSLVKLGIKRSTSASILPYEVVRGDIPVTSIDAAYIIEPSVGYIKVNKFGRNTYSEFLTSMVELKSKGAKRFIVDLRGNGGGFMEPAILMANEFLPAERLIVATRGRTEEGNSVTGSDGRGSFQEDELIVLIDEYSASASEIFAGAIQDNDRGLILGRRSFGKGLVQQQTMLPDSSAIRLTVARYYTPSGRCIQKIYRPGGSTDYNNELLDRYSHGELYNADSIKIDRSLAFSTMAGRTVYGGGGIIPDVFIPNDTTGVSSYYINIANAGLLQKFAFEYCDNNRVALSGCRTVADVLRRMPSDDALIQSFADFAARNKIPARWYYINISQKLIVNQLKALICRDTLSTPAFYEVYNTTDNAVQQALKEFKAGHAGFPLLSDGKRDGVSK